MICQIERLQTQFHASSLHKGKGLLDGRVKVDQAVRVQDVASRVAIGKSSWLRKRRKVEPVRRCRIRYSASLTNAVWPLAGCSIVGDVAAEDRRVRRAAAAVKDVRNFPSANQSVYESVGVAEHAVSVAEGKAIHR